MQNFINFQINKNFMQFLALQQYQILAYSLAFVALAAASISDLKKREVPDWLSYGLLALGFGLAAINALIFGWQVLAYSIAGFALFFIFAYIMFYSGQWGGGDSKVLMGIGALLGLQFSFSFPFVDLKETPFLITFFINLLIISFFYGIFWSAIIAFNKRGVFTKKFLFYFGRFRTERIVILVLAFASAFGFVLAKEPYLKLLLAFAAIFLVFSFYLWLFAKAVDDCMLRFAKPEELTEGDWVAEDVEVDGKYICGPKDLGIEKIQIEKLLALKRKGKVKNVLIKEGIPFIPSFLIAFVLSLFLGNIIGYFI